MANATPIPRSYGTEDTTTLPQLEATKQAAIRAAYIARVVSEAPPLSEAQLDHLAVLLRPSMREAAA